MLIFAVVLLVLYVVLSTISAADNFGHLLK